MDEIIQTLLQSFKHGNLTSTVATSKPPCLCRGLNCNGNSRSSGRKHPSLQTRQSTRRNDFMHGNHRNYIHARISHSKKKMRLHTITPRQRRINVTIHSSNDTTCKRVRPQQHEARGPPHHVSHDRHQRGRSQRRIIQVERPKMARSKNHCPGL